jgi:hypothetical protein
MYGPDGTVYSLDDGVRRDSSVEKLAKLKPVFDRTYGNVTAGNSSQVTDGAAMVILASEDVVNEYALKPLGRIVDTHWGALDPAEMGLGPVHAITPLLMRHGLTFADIDAVEVNEAFAAQVLGCVAAWDSAEYCKESFGLDRAFGAPDRAKLERRWRRHRHWPSHRGLRRARGAACAQGARAHRRKTRRRVAVHRRWPGRGDAAGKNLNLCQAQINHQTTKGRRA